MLKASRGIGGIGAHRDVGAVRGHWGAIRGCWGY